MATYKENPAFRAAFIIHNLLFQYSGTYFGKVSLIKSRRVDYCLLLTFISLDI